jgi:hypothetical protein
MPRVFPPRSRNIRAEAKGLRPELHYFQGWFLKGKKQGTGYRLTGFATTSERGARGLDHDKRRHEGFHQQHK